MNPRDERMWGMLAHLSALAGFIIPFGLIIGPLVIWLIKRDQSYYVNQQGKEALNFNISITIYFFISGLLIFLIVGIFTAIAVGVMWIIFTIIAAVKANNGEAYYYPLTIRFIK